MHRNTGKLKLIVLDGSVKWYFKCHHCVLINELHGYSPIALISKWFLFDFSIDIQLVFHLVYNWFTIGLHSN